MIKRRYTHYQKYLTSEEWRKITEWLETKLKSPSSRIVFYIMAFGLRVGEAVRLKRLDFNADFTKLYYTPLKKRGNPTIHERFIPPSLQERLQAYDKKHKRRYRNGFMFFPFANQSKNDHIQRSTISFLFTRLRKDLNFKEVYFVREGTRDLKMRALYRITPHTLRHYFSLNFYLKSNHNLVLTSQVLSHADVRTTARYINPLKASKLEQDAINQMVF